MAFNPEPWYHLAQVFATLAGVFLLVAVFAFSILSFNSALSLSFFDKSYQAALNDNLADKEMFLEEAKEITAKTQGWVPLAYFFVFLGLASAFLSLLAWRSGYKRHVCWPLRWLD